VAVQPPPAAEVDGAAFLDGRDALGGRRVHRAEQVVQRAPVHAAGTGHQPGRVSQVTRAALMHDDLGVRVHGGDVAHAAGVVQVDVRDHHRRQVLRADPQGGQRVTDHRRRRRGARLHQARPVAENQVAGRDALVTGHPGIDLVHIIPELGNAGGLRSVLSRVHATMVPDGAGRRRCPHRASGPAALVLRPRVVSERGRIVPLCG